jgi:hypothetical protein
LFGRLNNTTDDTWYKQLVVHNIWNNLHQKKTGKPFNLKVFSARKPKGLNRIGKYVWGGKQSLNKCFSPTCPKAKLRKILYLFKQILS